MDLDVVFDEEVLERLNTCVCLCPLSVDLESPLGVCFIEMPHQPLLRKAFKLVKNLLISRFEYEHFCGKCCLTDDFDSVLFLPFDWWRERHKNVFGIVVSPGITVQHISSVQTVVLAEAPFEAFVEQFIVEYGLHLVFCKRLEGLT